MHLHEVHPEGRKRVDRAASIVRRVHLDVRYGRIVSLEIWSRRDDPRAGESAGGYFITPTPDCREIAAHVSHTSDAVCDIKAQQLAACRDNGVNVHVPETRD